MVTEYTLGVERTRHLRRVTRDWGKLSHVSLFLDRCQVDTPDELVSATWAHVRELRQRIGKVVDFGAGDGRFASGSRYGLYIGYEIDPSRCVTAELSPNAVLLNRCAFTDEIEDADLCIGNPPFVRNQDLPEGWRYRAAQILLRRTGVTISGLANAWQYFFLLSLASLRKNGLCALVIPYEWVSRPAAKELRAYIEKMRWNVSVYRLVDTTFNSVLTTSSITIVDKAQREGKWRFFEETSDKSYVELPSASGAAEGVLTYLRRSEVDRKGPHAIRGVSPGTQKVLTLSEGERVRSGLRMHSDVVPCVTTLRNLPPNLAALDEASFQEHYRATGEKCWLIRTDKTPSVRLQSYLDAIPAKDYQTSTCLERPTWWKFRMPQVPGLLMSMSFRDAVPKVVRNSIGIRAVGGVCGIYNINADQAKAFISDLSSQDVRKRIVAHSNGMRKIEINQLNALLQGSGKA